MLDDHFLDITNLGFAIGIGNFQNNKVDLLTTYNADWQAEYFSLGGFEKDPVVRFGIRNTGLHNWNNNNPTNEFLRAAYDHDLCHGLAFAEVTAGSRIIAGISRKNDFTITEKAVIQTTIRKYHLDKLCELTLHLSPLQKTLVQLTAQGFRAKVVAHLLEVSEATIKQRKCRIQAIIGVNHFMCVTALAARAGFAFNPIN